MLSCTEGEDLFKKLILFLLLSLVLFPSLGSAKGDLSVGTIERLPFVYYGEDKKLTGFAIELWEEIARDSNFT